MSDERHNDPARRPCGSRRQFLLWGSGAAVSVVSVSLWGCGSDEKKEDRRRRRKDDEEKEAPVEEAKAVLAEYPRKKVASLSQLKTGQPVQFKYPSENPTYSSCFIVKLGERAGGGVGKEADVVAFNDLCTHMGGPLAGLYKDRFKAIGPCPHHLTSFDLTRYGMVISGHATESLPQIVLELEGDDVYATGVLGLVYGTYDSRMA